MESLKRAKKTEKERKRKVHMVSIFLVFFSAFGASNILVSRLSYPGLEASCVALNILCSTLGVFYTSGSRRPAVPLVLAIFCIVSLIITSVRVIISAIFIHGCEVGGTEERRKEDVCDSTDMLPSIFSCFSDFVCCVNVVALAWLCISIYKTSLYIMERMTKDPRFSRDDDEDDFSPKGLEKYHEIREGRSFSSPDTKKNGKVKKPHSGILYNM